MQGETVASLAGRVLVRYVTLEGAVRPAVVVEVLRDTESCNLVVFLNGPNETVVEAMGVPIAWKHAVEHDESKKPGTWHFPRIIMADAEIAYSQAGPPAPTKKKKGSKK